MQQLIFRLNTDFIFKRLHVLLQIANIPKLPFLVFLPTMPQPSSLQNSPWQHWEHVTRSVDCLLDTDRESDLLPEAEQSWNISEAYATMITVSILDR